MASNQPPTTNPKQPGPNAFLRASGKRKAVLCSGLIALVTLLSLTDSLAQKKPAGAIQGRPNRAIAKKSKTTSGYRGNQSTRARSNQNAGRGAGAKASSLATSAYRSNNNKKAGQTTAKKSKATSGYRGNQSTLSRSNQNAGRGASAKAGSLETSAYRGNQNVLARSNQNAGQGGGAQASSLAISAYRGNQYRGSAPRNRRMAAYSRRAVASSGEVSQSRINRRYRELRGKDSRMQAYRGTIRTNARSNQSAGLLINKGGGDLEMSAYRGNIARRSLRSRDKRIAKNNRSIRNYRGDIRVAKRPKGAYPGSTYRGGPVANSYQKKEKYRQRMLKRLGKSKQLQPNYQRRKEEKPTYDSRESEIWSKPGIPGSIKKK